jgi:membrane protein required for colicin V production
MTAFDYAVLGIVGMSVIISVWRGAVREVLALAAWIAAFVAAQAYAEMVATYLPTALTNQSLRLLGGFVLVFLLVLLLAALLAIAISKLIRSIGLGPVDRGLGAIFGLVRGILVVLTLVLLCGLTGAPKYPVWREAMLSPPLEAVVVSVRPFLPDELSRRISYE